MTRAIGRLTVAAMQSRYVAPFSARGDRTIDAELARKLLAAALEEVAPLFEADVERIMFTGGL